MLFSQENVCVLHVPSFPKNYYTLPFTLIKIDQATKVKHWIDHKIFASYMADNSSAGISNSDPVVVDKKCLGDVRFYCIIFF